MVLLLVYVQVKVKFLGDLPEVFEYLKKVRKKRIESVAPLNSLSTYVSEVLSIRGHLCGKVIN